MNKLILIFLIIVKISFAQELISITNLDDIKNIKKENFGKVLVFNFWASWCKPCMEEFPDLVKLYQNYKDNNLKLIFISLDFKEDLETKLRPFLKNNNVNFPSFYLDVNNPDEIMNYFDKKWDGGIPATFIFDISGKFQKFILGWHNFEFYEYEIKKLI